MEPVLRQWYRIVLLICGIVHTITCPLYADENDIIVEDLKHMKGEELYGNDSRFWQDLTLVAENIVIITKEEIETYPAQNLAEVLRYMPSFNLNLRTGMNQAVTYGMHGVEERHIRVMVDGVEFNNETSGQAGLASIPIGNIERIELIHSSASSRWGSALGGVINVITKDPVASPVPHGYISTMVGEHKQERYAVEVSGALLDVGYYWFGEYDYAGGVRNYDDTLHRNTSAKINYNFDNRLDISALAGYISSDDSEGIHMDDTWTKQKYYARYGKLAADWKINDALKVRFSSGINNQSARSITESNSRSEFHDESWMHSLESITRLRENDVLVLGSDFNFNSIKSLNLPSRASSHTEAFYANYSLNLDAFSLSAGLRYDRNSEYSGQVSPSVGFVYELPFVRESRIRGLFNRGFHSPPLAWMYLDTPFFESNPDLKPERSWNWELGFETHPIDWAWAKVNVYHSRISDYISTELIGGNFYMRNNSSFRKQGIELELKTKIGDCLYVTAGGTINDVENRAQDENVYSVSYARNSVDIGILYNHEKGFMAHLLGHYQRNRVKALNPHESEFVWDLKLKQSIHLWKSIHVEGFLNVHNIFNSAYWIDEYYPHPSRHFEGGITVRF